MRLTFDVLCKRCAIICVGLMLLAGCSAVRLSYNQGPQLATWWIDGYLDLDDQQEARVKQALDQWFAWHRQTQLADYFTLLARARNEFDGPVSGGMACQWADRIRSRLDPALERALPAMAEIAATLRPAQLEHLQARYEKNNAKLRKQILQPDATVRREEATKRTIERFEDFYGTLGEVQRSAVVAGVAASPFDGQAWMAEREKRQREVLDTLRWVITERPPQASVLPRLRALVGRFSGAPSPQAPAWQQPLTEYNCNFAAEVHNAATSQQRRHLHEKLLAWEGDLRQLAAESRGQPLRAARAPAALLR